MRYSYKTQGVCAVEIHFDLDGDVVSNVQFVGGCPGNTQGVARLVTGRNIDDVISMLEGIPCGKRKTSCPDQLAKALKAYKQEQQGA